MEPLSDLNRDISTGLRDDLTAHMLPGETIVISLPGSFGEALVVTDRRAIVVREKPSALVPMADVFAYPRSQMSGAVAITSGAGGYIEFRLAQPPADPDSARVYFPITEESRFKAAADYLSQPVPEVEAAPVQPVAGAVGATGAWTCPKCGGSLDDGAAFCGQCGVRVRTICLGCGAASPVGSKFCESCGREMSEFSAECHKCGARVLRWMSYCPECGSVQRPTCAGCGVQVMPDWKFCASCGRRFGGDPIVDAVTARAAQRLKDWEAQRTSQPAAEEPIEQAPRPAVMANPAETHNLRGKELCENDDYEGAIREFQAAVQLEPNNAGYHCNLAVAYDGADRDEEALAEYKKTLELAPNDLTALLYLGYMYSEDDQMDKAQEVWGQLLQIAPDSAEAQEVLQALRHQGEL